MQLESRGKYSQGARVSEDCLRRTSIVLVAVSPQSAATCFTVERSILRVWEPGAHTHAVTRPCLESRWLTETGWREVDKRSLAVSSTNRRRGFSSPRSPDRRETAHRAGAGRARRRATANSLYKHDALEGRADAVRAWGLLGPTRAVSGHPRWADLRCGWPTSTPPPVPDGGAQARRLSNRAQVAPLGVVDPCRHRYCVPGVVLVTGACATHGANPRQPSPAQSVSNQDPSWMEAFAGREPVPTGPEQPQPTRVLQSQCAAPSQWLGTAFPIAI
jgi:hypothetical protein